MSRGFEPLTGERGYSSAHLSQLLEPTSIFWNLGASLAVTLFDHDKTLGNVRLTEAKKLELAEAYRGAVLAALRDVEDGLAGVRLLAEQEGDFPAAAKALQDSAALKDDARSKAIPVLAFANHEEVDNWRRAQQLGVTKIVSRNEFSSRTLQLVEEVVGLGTGTA